MVMLWLHHSCVVVAAMTAASARREAVLRLPRQPGENKGVCSAFGASRLLPAFPVSALPTLGTANSVKGETIGIMNKISNTGAFVSMQIFHSVVQAGTQGSIFQ